MPRATHAGAFRVRFAAVLTAVYAAFVLLVTLWPTTVDRGLDPYIERILVALHARGVPTFVDYAFVEFSANIGFFVPVGFLLAILITRRLQWLAVLCAAVLSTGVEVAQWLFLPGRVASAADVLANTIGAAIGCGAAVLVRLVILHRDRLVIRDLLEGRRDRGEAPGAATDVEGGAARERAAVSGLE
jgi:glycopeptide antibiotics resistance protein